MNKSPALIRAERIEELSTEVMRLRAENAAYKHAFGENGRTELIAANKEQAATIAALTAALREIADMSADNDEVSRTARAALAKVRS